jgi:hypothetical protein
MRNMRTLRGRFLRPAGHRVPLPDCDDRDEKKSERRRLDRAIAACRERADAAGARVVPPAVRAAMERECNARIS